MVRATFPGKKGRSTNVFVGNDLHTLNMTSSLEYLLQHILGNSLVKTSHIKSTLVRFWSSSSHRTSGATRRHHASCAIGTERRRDCRRDWVAILRNNDRRQRGWRHVGWISRPPIGRTGSIPVLAWCGSALWRRWQRGGCLCGSCIRHVEDDVDIRAQTSRTDVMYLRTATRRGADNVEKLGRTLKIVS